MTPKLSLQQAIRMWVRFIDDCFGIWRGTKRSFDNFVKQLNAETSKYGIKFPLNEVQFGRLVHFLEVCLYLDEHNVLHYCGYTKPTDAKRYLNPNSFHPKAVFDSIPFSQMLRTIRNNSCDNNRTNELKQTINHFVSSGYKLEKLNELKTKALQKSTQQHNPRNGNTNTLIFPVHYFDSIADLKSLLRSLGNELQQLIGDRRVMVATKKRSSIGNSVVKNK